MTDAKGLNFAKKFNKEVRRLAAIWMQKKKNSPDEDEVYRDKQRMDLIIKQEPLYIMVKGGPYLLKYGTLIEKRNWDELVGKSFSDDIKKYRQAKNYGPNKRSAVETNLKFVKHIIKKGTASERKVIGDSLKEMLSTYCEFVLHEKRRKS